MNYIMNKALFILLSFFILATLYPSTTLSAEPIRVLIVPGHDDDSWGTEYNGIREADLTMRVGEALAAQFAKNSAYEATLLRGRDGYLSAFETYFAEHREVVRAEVVAKKKIMKDLLAAGSVERVEGVGHNKAALDVALRLYAINKWANENAFHLVLHLHFNDFGGRTARNMNQYGGFALYVPDGQYSNARASYAVAESLFSELSSLFTKSNLPKEDGGVVEDQWLIATGSNNSVNNAAVLIEYGYIYEPVFQDKKTRAIAISDLSLLTYLGIKDYFGGDPEFKSAYLPYSWRNNLKRGVNNSLDVLSLQAVLMREEVYPPAGFSRNDCPLSGNFGPCTERAVKLFQKKYNLEPVGEAGPKTRAKLNKLYGI